MIEKKNQFQRRITGLVSYYILVPYIIVYLSANREITNRHTPINNTDTENPITIPQ